MFKLIDDYNNYFMNEAIFEAKNAYIIGEVPVGAVLVYKNKIIGRGHNMREHTQNSTMHAEILAINEACCNMHSWRLLDTKLFVTLEPCIMCCGAIINSRISEVYYGTVNSKYDNDIDCLLENNRMHKVIVKKNICKNECSSLLTDFFKNIRRKDH